MALTQEQAAVVLKQAGLKPWEGTVSEDPNDPESVLVTRHQDTTTPSGSIGTFTRNAAAAAPNAIGSALAMTAAAPLIAGGAELGGKAGLLGGPFAEVTVPAGALIGGALPAIAAGAAGSELVNHVPGLSRIKEMLLGNNDQRLRDEAEHPYASTLGRVAANAVGFRAPGSSLLTGGAKIIPAALGKASLNAAEQTALKTAAVNAGVGATVNTAEQLAGDKKFEPGQVLGAAAEAAPFGAPRFGKASTAQAAPPVMGDPEPSPLTPREVEKMANLREAGQLERGSMTPDELMMAQQQLDYAKKYQAGQAIGEEQKGREINMTGAPVDRPQVPPTPTPNAEVPPNFVRPAESGPVQSPARRPGRPTPLLEWNPQDAPTPESAPNIAESLRITADPNAGKQASFIPEGTPIEHIPKNLKTIQHPKGLVAYNPEKVAPGQAQDIVAGDQIKGTALGLSQDTKPAGHNNAAVVSDSGGQPAVLTEVVPNDPAAIAKAQATQQAAAPGSEQRVTTPEEVVQTRASDILLQKLDALKVNFEPGQLNDITRVVPGVVWNAGIDVAKLAIRAGRSVTDAITAAIEHMRAKGAKFDEGEMRQRIEDRLSGAGYDVGSPKPENTAPQALVPDSGIRGAGSRYVPDAISKQVNSLLYNTSRNAPEVGNALAHQITEARHLEGAANAVMDPLRGNPKLANAIFAKRLEAMQTGQAPRFTPEERAANQTYDAWAQHTRDEANARGKDINAQPFYVPQMVDTALGNKYAHNSEQFLAETTPRFVKYQQEVAAKRGQTLPASEALQAKQYWKDHWINANKQKLLPSAVQGDFGALTKDARQFHLPPEYADPDAVRSLERYNKRYANQLSREQWVDSQPNVVNRLQEGDMNDVNHLLRGDLGSVNKDFASPLIGSTQRLANTAIMQLPSAIWQSIQKIPDHLIHGAEVPLLWHATVKTARDYAEQRQAAIRAGVVKPGHDYTVGDNQTSLADRTARAMDAISTAGRKYTLSGWIENANRIHDFSIGQLRAEKSMAGQDPAFLDKFNEGAHRGLTPEQNRDRMAGNYAESIQGTYGAKGLPAWLLKGSTPAQLMRIQRFGVENALRTVQYTIEPAAKGNFGPLVSYLLAGTVAAPVIQKVHEILGGIPGAVRDAAQGKEVTGERLLAGKQSNLPTMKEIDTATADPSTGRSLDLEYALNAMSLADLAGTYGFLGKAAGLVSSNVRGQSQGIVSDPGATLTLTTVKNFAAAAEAIYQGEPAVDSILEAAKRTLFDNMQMTRGLTKDAGEAQDSRDKGVFAYLSGRKNTPIPAMIMGGTAGDVLSGNVRGITPTEDAARQGDKAAFASLSPDKQMRLFHYPGAYANVNEELPHVSFMEQTRGPEAVQDYLKRQRAYQERIRQALPIGQ